MLIPGTRAPSKLSPLSCSPAHFSFPDTWLHFQTPRQQARLKSNSHTRRKQRSSRDQPSRGERWHRLAGGLGTCGVNHRNGSNADSDFIWLYKHVSIVLIATLETNVHSSLASVLAGVLTDTDLRSTQLQAPHRSDNLCQPSSHLVK